MKKLKLMSVADYARACGVGTAAIYLRKEKGELKLSIVSGVMCVDTQRFPVVRKRKGGRPKAASYL